jgi:hypothetical protein
MNSPEPGADGASGLLTTRECRAIFKFGERDLRRAINWGRLPITVVNGKAMIDSADAVACIKPRRRRICNRATATASE